MSEILDIARQYVAAGLSVIPITPGGKMPDYHRLKETTGLTTNWTVNDERAIWRVYCGRMATDDELVTWFADGEAGIGIVGGAISGGLVRIDFEHNACLLTWQADLRRADPILAVASAALPVVQTGKGHHVYFRMPDPPGHVILSSAHGGNELLVLAETQGEGCYCVAPPSVVPDSYRYESGVGAVYDARYEWATVAPFQAIPTLDQDLANTLLEAARFRELWELQVAKVFQTRALLGRDGLLLERHIGGTYDDWHLDWQTLGKLRAYFERYDTLLKAVETAPPPPPSYDIYDDGDYDDD